MLRISSSFEGIGSFANSGNCSYLDIYFSRKIRLSVVDLKGKFQTNLQAKLTNFFVWKLLIFLIFFAEFVKSSIAFYTLLLLFQRDEIFELQFLHQITIQMCQQCVKSIPEKKAKLCRKANCITLYFSNFELGGSGFSFQVQSFELGDSGFSFQVQDFEFGGI